MLIEDQKLDGVISLPGGVFKPYAGVSTAILLFTQRPTPAEPIRSGFTM
jgi:type I restriction enzyme M protein